MTSSNIPLRRILLLLPGLVCLFAGPAACAASVARFVLPNGLQVVVYERHAAPLVAIELWVRAGSRDEKADETGAAHFLEHTLFKGTASRAAGQADVDIENLGATLGAATGPDYARFYTAVAADHAADALSVLADVVRNATLPAPDIERERQVIRDELAQRESDPTSLLVERLYASMLRGLPYSRPPGGTPEAIQRCTRETLAAFYRRNYAPARCVLVLVGDITPDRAHQVAGTNFGDWSPQKQDPAAAQSLPPTPARAAGPIRTAEPAEIGRPMVGVAFAAPAASATTTARCAEIVAAMLGESDAGGRLATARLSGCAASAGYTPRRDESLFIITASMPAAVAARARTRSDLALAASVQEQAIVEVIDSLTTAPPGASELRAAKTSLLGRATFRSETDTGLASELGSAEISGGSAAEEWRAEIESVSLSEVRDFIARWMTPVHRVSLVLLPRADRAGAEVRP